MMLYTCTYICTCSLFAISGFFSGPSGWPHRRPHYNKINFSQPKEYLTPGHVS